VKKVQGRLRLLAGLLHNLGVGGAISFVRARAAEKLIRGRCLHHLRTPLADHPLVARPGSSDLAVFSHVFIHREYACVDSLPDVRLAIDCGANVGYSSAYFLSRWPASEVMAVEPDPGNLRILSRNLAPYGPRARIVEGALWSRSGGLAMSDGRYRDGREWTRQVRDCDAGERGTVAAYDIPALLTLAGHRRVSLLKIDIEGAEAIVFRGACEWLDLVDNLVVELHDDTDFGSASEAFRRAIAGRHCAVEQSGELTVCRGL
jgi:FkbM family methyltransferase